VARRNNIKAAEEALRHRAADDPGGQDQGVRWPPSSTPGDLPPLLFAKTWAIKLDGLPTVEPN